MILFNFKYNSGISFLKTYSQFVGSNQINNSASWSPNIIYQTNDKLLLGGNIDTNIAIDGILTFIDKRTGTEKTEIGKNGSFYIDYNYQKNYDRLSYLVENETIYTFGIANLTQNYINLGQQIYTFNSNISEIITGKNTEFIYQDILKISSSSYLINFKIIGKDSNSIYLSGGYMPSLDRNAEYKSILIKTNLNGKIDESFGKNGIITEENSNLQGGINDGLISNNKIFTAQTLKLGNSITGVIVSYNLDGSTNKTFGTNGLTNLKREFKSVENLISLRSGDMLAYGESSINSQPKIVKINNLGEIDETFGSSGFIQLDFSSYKKTDLNWFSELTLINDIYSLQDSSLIITGSYQGYLYVVKLLKNGTLDKTFANNGIYFESDKIYNGYWLPQSDLGVRFNAGKSIIADENYIYISAYFNGYPDNANSNTGTVIKPYLIKLNMNGSLDKSFGGIDSLIDTINFTEGSSAVVLDSTIDISIDQHIGKTFLLKIESSHDSDLLYSNLLSVNSNDVVSVNGKPIAGLVSNISNEIIFRIFNNWDVDSFEKFLESITYKSNSKNPNPLSKISYYSKLNSTDPSWDFIDSLNIMILMICFFQKSNSQKLMMLIFILMASKCHQIVYLITPTSRRD